MERLKQFYALVKIRMYCSSYLSRVVSSHAGLSMVRQRAFLTSEIFFKMWHHAKCRLLSIHRFIHNRRTVLSDINIILPVGILCGAQDMHVMSPAFRYSCE